MITRKVNKIARNIDGIADLSDDDLLALVKKSLQETAKICSRGLWGYNEHYASASGAICKAYGQTMFSDLGFSQEWQDGFAEGFEYTGNEMGEDFYLVPKARPMGSEEFNRGFDKGLWIADQVFRHWPESPDIHSVPEDVP